MAGCQCRHGRHAASRISRPTAAATGAAVATACGSSRSLEQLPSANKAAGWKEEAEVAADGGVHRAGRVGGVDSAAGQASSRAFRAGRTLCQPDRAGQQQTGNSLQAQQLAVEHSSNVIIFLRPSQTNIISVSLARATLGVSIKKASGCKRVKTSVAGAWLTLVRPLGGAAATTCQNMEQYFARLLRSCSIISLRLVLGPPRAMDSVLAPGAPEVNGTQFGKTRTAAAHSTCP